METYLKNLQNQSGVMYPSDYSQLFHGQSNLEQYPHINFGGSNQMMGESLPNEEQLCNFLSSLDSSTSLTFEKLLQSSNQANTQQPFNPISNQQPFNPISNQQPFNQDGYWCNNYNLNPPKPPTYNFPAPENSISFFTPPSRPRIIRGCHDRPVDRWNANVPDHSLYATNSAATDLNNNVMPSLNKNYSHDDITPKKYECTERQCQEFLLNQYFQTKDVDCDLNNNVTDDNNNNACALVEQSCILPEESDVTYELKIMSFLYHNRHSQTLAGKVHTHLGLSMDQLKGLTQERQKIEKSLFSDVTSTSFHFDPDRTTRIERLVGESLDEIEPVKRIVAKSNAVCSEKIKSENKQLIDSWIESIENVKLSFENRNMLSEKEYLSQQAINLKSLCDQTRSIRTCLWCAHILVT